MSMDAYDKHHVVLKLEEAFGRHIIDPLNPERARSSLAEKRLRIEKELEELKFVEEAIEFMAKWKQYFPAPL